LYLYLDNQAPIYLLTKFKNERSTRIAGKADQRAAPEREFLFAEQTHGV
jgi:hypothetical protein